jgi:hypothetical protein
MGRPAEWFAVKLIREGIVVVAAVPPVSSTELWRYLAANTPPVMVR